MLSASLHDQAQAIAELYTPPDTGRPSSIGESTTVQKFLAAIREGCYAETAAKFAGLSKVTYYDWKKRGESGEEPYATFLNAVEKAEADAECDAMRNVRQAGKLPQFWAAEMTYLERRHPERWGRRNEGSNEPRVVVQIGVKDSDVQVTIGGETPLSPVTFASEPGRNPDANPLELQAFASASRPIIGHSVNDSAAQPTDPPATSGARSAEGPSPARPRVRRGRGVRAKSAVAGGKEKKA